METTVKKSIIWDCCLLKLQLLIEISYNEDFHKTVRRIIYTKFLINYKFYYKHGKTKGKINALSIDPRHKSLNYNQKIDL